MTKLFILWNNDNECTVIKAEVLAKYKANFKHCKPYSKKLAKKFGLA